MSCTNCKNKKRVEKVKEGIDSVLNSYSSSIDEQKLKLGDKLMSGSGSILNNLEKVGVTIFAWIPLVIGYYHIIKFIITLI